MTKAWEWLRYDLPAKLGRQGMIAAGLGVVIVLVLVVALTGAFSGGENKGEAATRVVTVSVTSDDPADAPVGTLGFPLVATRNTTRVGGADPTVDAAAVALATHPPAPGAPPIEAAVVVGDWQSGVAASVLAGPPLRAPILVGASGQVPQPTADAIAKLKPRGGSGPDDVAVYTVGDADAPSDLQSEAIAGSSPAESANAVDQLRGKLLKSEPAHILVVSSDEPAYAMPAAAWAARSGDPVLFTGRDDVPDATLEALRRHRGAPVYVLGPESVVSDEAVRKLERASPGVIRIGEEGPVENAIAFATFVPTGDDSSFGWNINDPGHGLVLANTDRPLDAAASATLSASGTWGPLLVTDSPGALPPELRSFLLDIKPGFEDDPTRAVYNHVWLIGDTSAIGAKVQADIDELAEVTEVGPGAGGTVAEGTSGSAINPQTGQAQPTGPEPEPQAPTPSGGKKP
jgi:hypothetical protein